MHHGAVTDTLKNFSLNIETIILRTAGALKQWEKISESDRSVIGTSVNILSQTV